MSKIEIDKVNQRIFNRDPAAISLLQILRNNCPFASNESRTGNEGLFNIILRYINHFMLHTTTLESEDNVHAVEIREHYGGEINSKILNFMCKDNIFVKLILELKAHRQNVRAVIELITSNLTDLPLDIIDKQDLIIESFKYIKDVFPTLKPIPFYLKYLQDRLRSRAHVKPFAEETLRLKNELLLVYKNNAALDYILADEDLAKILYKLFANKLRPELFIDVLINPE